jgi:hypothetical protein
MLGFDDNERGRVRQWDRRQPRQIDRPDMAMGDGASLHSDKRRRAIHAWIDPENEGHCLSFINTGQGRAGHIQ